MPTEEDILRWLTEAEDEADHERRVEWEEERAYQCGPGGSDDPADDTSTPPLRIRREVAAVADEPLAMRRVV